MTYEDFLRDTKTVYAIIRTLEHQYANLLDKPANFYKTSKLILLLNGNMQFRKVAFPAFMLATGLYILLPTADEIIIHPTLGWLLAYALHTSYVEGVLLSVIIYRLIGIVCLSVALLVGGKPVYQKFKEKLLKNRFRR